MKKFFIFTLTLLAVLGTSALVLADSTQSVAALNVIGNVALAAGLGIGLGVLGPGFAMGLTMLGALTGMARNPEMVGTLRIYMLIGLALIESLAIYALVISLILLYAFPYADNVIPLIGGATTAPAAN
ncbi:MAG: ATP synthase F0 subunit C [Deltaproteobacteria bacterium]|jgi:F-type H+-transporting ATPase subunit c|nr:ATP synthase F0 subunit C [Deltaproteobacteria bacterium]